MADEGQPPGLNRLSSGLLAAPSVGAASRRRRTASPAPPPARGERSEGQEDGLGGAVGSGDAAAPKLKAAQEQEEAVRTASAASDADSWRTRRLAIGLFCGYGYYNTMRGTFPLQMFTIATELDIPMNRIGVPNSSFSAAYGVAKFFGSVGVLQAFGWPFLARMVVTEMPEAARAKYWGALSMAGSVGAMITPYGIVLSRRMGLAWRGTMVAAGASAGIMSLVVLWLLLSSRSRGGTSPGEAAAGKEKGAVGSTSKASSAGSLASPFWVALFLTNALAYFCSKTTKEWGSIYLRGTNFASSDMQAATLLFWGEVGGAIGAFSSGFVSSSLLGGRHALTCTLSALLAAAALGVMAWFSYISGEGVAPFPFVLACLLQAIAQVGLNGVRALAGFHAAEVASRNGMVGLANGWMEIVGQCGSVAAGQPLGALAVYASGSPADSPTKVGWIAVLCSLAMASVLMAVLNATLLPQEQQRLSKQAESAASKKSQ